MTRRLPLVLLFLLLGAAAAPLEGPAPPPDYDAEHLERLVLEAVNHTRQARSLSALRLDPDLQAVARSHSLDLARTGRMGHRGSDGTSPAGRMRRHGLSFQALAENVYRAPLFAYCSYVRPSSGGISKRCAWEPPERLAALAVDGWLNSPGHRANLLGESFVGVGVGVAFDAQHRWIVTLNLRR